jgi:hypothetical protein
VARASSRPRQPALPRGVRLTWDMPPVPGGVRLWWEDDIAPGSATTPPRSGITLQSPTK